MVLTPTQRRLGLAMELTAMEELVKNAVDGTFYVAGGKVLARDMAERFSIPLDEAQRRIAKMAEKLVDHIREMVG